MSSPGPSLPTLFLTSNCGALNHSCLPPCGVIDSTVAGKGACLASSARRDASPFTPCFISTSNTTTPDCRPQTTAILASGHCVHHSLTVSGSVVAFFSHSLTIGGNLRWGLIGKTRSPRDAKCCAALRYLSVIAQSFLRLPQRPHRRSPKLPACRRSP